MAMTKLWTIEEVAHLPEDGFRYTLIKGEIYRMPPPMGQHGLVVLAIGWHLYGFVKEQGLGLVYDQSGFILERDPDTLLDPDLAFVSNARIPENRAGYPAAVPDLVVEVASPSQTSPSIETKVALYLAVGVRLVWIVNPDRRTVRIHRSEGSQHLMTEDDELKGEDILPGFRLPVARLFA